LPHEQTSFREARGTESSLKPKRLGRAPGKRTMIKKAPNPID